MILKYRKHLLLPQKWWKKSSIEITQKRLNLSISGKLFMQTEYSSQNKKAHQLVGLHLWNSQSSLLKRYNWSNQPNKQIKHLWSFRFLEFPIIIVYSISISSILMKYSVLKSVNTLSTSSEQCIGNKLNLGVIWPLITFVALEVLSLIFQQYFHTCTQFKLLFRPPTQL